MLTKIILSNRLQALLPEFITYKSLVNNVRCENRLYIEVPMFIPGNVGNFFDIRNNEISYCPSNKEQKLSEAGKWKREGRASIRCGKFASLLNYSNVRGGYVRTSVPAAAIEAVVNAISSDACSIEGLRVSGNISRVYGMDTDRDRGGYLTSSCMRPESDYGVRHYAAFYDDVPGLKILYGTSEKGLAYRALFWLVEINGKKRFFIDRIYSTDIVNSSLTTLAKRRGWMWRRFDSSTIYDGDTKINEPVLFPSNIDFMARGVTEGTPYMDTLCYYDDGMGFRTDERGNAISVQDCSGHALGGSFECESCGSCIDEDDIIYIDGNAYCEDCVTYCEGCGEYHVESNVNMVECGEHFYCEEYALNHNWNQCDECGEWRRDCICAEDGNMYCEDCYNDKFTWCEECECEMLREDSTEGPDGNWYCEDCYNNKFAVCEECGDVFIKDELNEDGICENCVLKMEDVENECK